MRARRYPSPPNPLSLKGRGGAERERPNGRDAYSTYSPFPRPGEPVGLSAPQSRETNPHGWGVRASYSPLPRQGEGLGVRAAHG